MADYLKDLVLGGLNIGGDLLSGYLAGQGAEDAADTYTNALREGTQASKEAVAQGRSDILSSAEPGLTDLLTGYQGAVAVTEQEGLAEQKARALAGVLGPEAQAAAQAEFTESPGQKFLREQQEQTILRNANATGGLRGGRVLSQLQEDAFGRANTTQQQHINNLMQLGIPENQRNVNIANLLSAGGGQIAGFRSGIGSNLANLAIGGAAQQIPLITGTGAAQAAGSLGYGQALSQGVSNASKTLGSMYR